jgi:alcohol dehydrogenase, propanol-preferring
MLDYHIAAFGAPLVKREQPTPVPEGREVLIEVRAAGVCHTDIHLWHGYYDLGGGKRLNLKERGISLPITPGHEIAGTLAAAGSAADGCELGQNYVVYPWIGCGECKVCQRGQEHWCAKPRSLGLFRPGGYADHVLVPDSKYLIDIGDMPPERAAPFACSGLTTYSAIRKIPDAVLREEKVVIIGAGGLGLMCVALVNALGGSGTVVVEPNEQRRAAALSAGAANVIDSSSDDVTEQIKSATGSPAWAVIDCVGSGDTVQLGLSSLAKGGQIVVLGLFGGETHLSPTILTMRAITMQGSYVGSLSELRDLMDIVREAEMPYLPITCCSLDHAPSALQELEDGKVVGRYILQPSARS